MSKTTNVQKIEKAKNVAEKDVKMNASQKLEALENIIQKQSNQINIIADEIDRLSNVITALAKRVNAIVRTGDEGQKISTEQVNALLVSDAAKELQGKVNFLVQQGILVLNNNKEIDDNTFVVGRELNSEGEEINPRVQFAVKSLEQDGQNKVKGKKAGDSIVGDDGINMEILEVFDIVTPQEKQP